MIKDRLLITGTGDGQMTNTFMERINRLVVLFFVALA